MGNPAPVHTSLLIATHNGAATLPDVLEGLVPSAGSRAAGDARSEELDGVEIIVVDNASTDDTGEVCRRFADRLPLRLLHEARRGKNVALNRALDVARGNLMIFTDDDVVLPPDFLPAYRALAERESGYDLFGGRVVARWESPPDSRILGEVPLGLAFTLSPPGRASGPARAHTLYGPNMAITRRVFDSGLRFDEAIGPDGRSCYAMGSETELLQRAEAGGYAALYEAGICVEHKVRTTQLAWRWLDGRASRAGRGELQLQRRLHGSLPSVKLLLGYPRWALGECARAKLASVLCGLRPSGTGALAKSWRSAYLRGYLSEYRVEHRRARAPVELDD